MIDFLTDVLTDNYHFIENSVNLYPFHLCILHFNNSRVDFFNMFYGIIVKIVFILIVQVFIIILTIIY